MTFLRTALAGAATLTALSAHAQLQEGPYVGLGLGTARYHGPDIGGLPTDRTSGGGKVWGGWDFTPYFAAEAGYADLGKTGSPAGDVKTRAVFLDAVGKYPFNQSLVGFGRVGVQYARGETSLDHTDTGTDVKYGLGLQYNLNKQVGLRGEWERYRVDVFDNKTDVDLYTLGVNYKF